MIEATSTCETSVNFYLTARRNNPEDSDLHKTFLFTTTSTPTLGTTQCPIQGTPRALFPGVKRPGHEADHSRISIAVVKKAWSYISIPHVCMVWCLIKHRGIFTCFNISDSPVNPLNLSRREQQKETK
jgi:hypothetical protein